MEIVFLKLFEMSIVLNGFTNSPLQMLISIQTHGAGVWHIGAATISQSFTRSIYGADLEL